MGETAFAPVKRLTDRLMVIAGVAPTLGVGAVPARAARPTTNPGSEHGQASGPGPSFGLIFYNRFGRQLLG